MYLFDPFIYSAKCTSTTISVHHRCSRTPVDAISKMYTTTASFFIVLVLLNGHFEFPPKRKAVEAGWLSSYAELTKTFSPMP